ncbi:MAG: isocitrate lyase/phosphoenolpyruvate mutase family protein [Candidatus Omnitrophica bacterium]|nr:isocitrate lyase/phosphoenolpyruvate mutase family protein [Candidatus Omnitrophota bacterium]
MKKSIKGGNFFEKKGLLRIVGAHDGLSAKLVELNGFDGVWASGLEISASYAVPDASILTMSQYLERACEIRDAVTLPVIADCDTGYGNSNNTIYMVKKYEAAGITGVCIEDKKFPKVNSLLDDGRQELAPIAEFVGKIMAAKNARISKDFLVIARVEALIAGWGEEEALLRAEKYAEAGADAILIHSKSKAPGEVLSFAEKWQKKVPLVLVPTTYPSIMDECTDEELLEKGVKMVIFANQGMRSSIKALNLTLREMKKTGGISGIEDKIAPLGEIFDLQGLTDLRHEEKKFLRSEHGDVTVIIPAAGKPNHQGSMEPLLRDRPVCMIDINGKSILERGLDILDGMKFGEINVIVGYEKKKALESLAGKKARFIHNSEYEKKHILHSFMLAGKDTSDRTLMVYSDILFDRALIEKVLKQKHDIVLVGDSTYTRFGHRNKKLELISVREKMSPGRRSLGEGMVMDVARIGKNVDERTAAFEFVGIAYFSAKGIRAFKRAYSKVIKSPERKKKFHEAVDISKASFTDMVQELIDGDVPVKVMPVNSGWMEVHSFEDYNFACSRIKDRG